MPYDDEIAERIRHALDHEPDVSERRMFGGLAFLVGGRMAIAASSKGGAMVRIDPEACEALVSERGVERMVMGGREMDGWLRVDAQALVGSEALRRWVQTGTDFARSLPPK